MLRMFPFPRHPYQHLPLYVTIAGVDHLQEPIQRPKGMPFYQWFICAKGRGEVILQHERCILSEGQGAMICPGSNHAYRALTDDWTLDFLGFTGPAVEEMMKVLRMSESRLYGLDQPSAFSRRIQEMMGIRKENRQSELLLLSQWCYAFLTELSVSVTRLESLPAYGISPAIEKIALYLEENHAQPFSLDALSLHMNMTKAYLCHLFAKGMKQTIVEYLTAIRIGHAQVLLLQNPETKAYDIGKKCGFESPSYFGKIFKKYTGMSPNQYRYHA